MLHKASFTIRLLMPLVALFFAASSITGEARAALGPEYNAAWEDGTCYGNHIQIHDPSRVADIGLTYQRIVWMTTLYRQTSSGWLPAIAGRDFVKRGGYHYGWAYRGGYFYADAPNAIEEYAILNSGNYAVVGSVYYYYLLHPDWANQWLRLMINEDFASYSYTACNMRF
jgi:hypothetical protein